MTLPLQPLSSHHPGSLATAANANKLAAPAGFADLDERIAGGAPGLVLIRATSRDAAFAAVAHVARRVAACGGSALAARARAGSPLWRELGAMIGLASLPCDAARCAEEVAHACIARRAVVIAPLPAAGTWDRIVAAELASIANVPLAVFVTDSSDSAPELRAETFDLEPTLDAGDLRRWWAAVAEDGHRDVTNADLVALESWWGTARRATAAEAPRAEALDEPARALLAALSLAARAWPASDLAMLGHADRERALEALTRAGAARTARGFVSVAPEWDATADAQAAAADAARIGAVAAALIARFPDDPWTRARAAELLVRADAPQAADDAHAAAIARVDDTAARRELVGRWMQTVATLPRPAQLPLRVRAAERALAVGEADEAFRWAQSATAIAPDDAAVTLLFGRAAVAMGDLVAAKVALQRGQALAGDGDTHAQLAVELAEVAYLTGDLATAGDEATHALESATGAETRLRGRNVLGKILLAQAKWDEADAHFAEDAWNASSSGSVTAELRARLNRGIALLSKGLMDEARSIFESVLAEGERVGDARACAFALDNLAVVASIRHQLATALTLSERTLRLRQRLGDRLTTARILANLAELRLKLGLLDHAEHAIAFGRRTLGPGMPPARSARFCIVAGKVALARGNTAEARREIARATTDFEAAGQRGAVGEANRVSARIALEDGDLARAAEALAAARDLSPTEDGRAEVAVLTALHARASGDNDDRFALEALALARAVGDEELLIEAHKLLCEIHRSGGSSDTARAHLDQAVALRDQIAETLGHDVRAAFLARADNVALSRLQSIMSEPSTSDVDPPTQRARTSMRPGAPPRELVGDDPAIRGLLAAVKKVARSNSTVLVRGESGTGKELVADAIHRASDRANGPLVTVNCAALVETLLLSELFGHEKGAFTGAIARRRGRFELAEGGTLFLDEIGDISARTQVALLRVLQERTFERVGGTTPIRANVRIICATHRDLKAMVERGEFREDLYYRLRGITLELPALRMRMGDLPRIAEHLLARIAAERCEEPKAIAPDAIDLLSRHRWPGNVRELENALRAASLFADGDVITAACLIENVEDLRAVAQSSPPSVRSGRTSYIPPAPPTEVSLEGTLSETEDGEDGGELPMGEANATAVAYAQVRQGSVSLSDIKRQIERDCIARALAETKGNITRAAALLGMKRPRLSQLVKQYGLAAVSSEAS